MNQLRDLRQTQAIALINGTQREYQACDLSYAKGARLFASNWKYLGQGVIYSIDGTIQKTSETYHFWGDKA